MRKVLVISWREYLASVRSKAFVISLVIMPVFMGGSILVQELLKGVKDTQKKHFAVVDRTPGEKLYAAIAREAGAEFVIEKEDPSPNNPAAVNRQRYELSERVRRGELFGFVEVGPDVFQPPASGRSGDRAAVRYQTNTPTYEDFPRLVDRVVNEAVQKERLKEAGVRPDKRKDILSHVPLVRRLLSRKTAEGRIEEAPEQNPVAAFVVPFGMMMLMFMVIMVGATPLVQGIVEEKIQRIAEVLLGSVRPFQLMMGKLLGIVGVSLTLVAVYLAGAYWAAERFDFADLIPVDLLVWFLVYQVLSVLMYGSLFIAVGAACTDTKETQTMLLPVMLLACLPMFVMANVIREPNSSFALGASLFPFATPMLMIARQAVPPGIPVWQPVVGVVLVLATTLLCVYAAGRIFRVGILMQGKGAKFGEMIKWVFRG